MSLVCPEAVLRGVDAAGRDGAARRLCQLLRAMRAALHRHERRAGGGRHEAAPALLADAAPLDPQSQFVLSALRINLRSERITVGDALCHLFSSGAPRAIITLLINAVRHRGVNMPLSDMLGECAELLGGVTRSTSAVVEENEKLKKLALVSLTFSPPACETASAGDDGEVGTLNDETMRRVMMACRLRRGKRSLLVRRARRHSGLAPSPPLRKLSRRSVRSVWRRLSTPRRSCSVVLTRATASSTRHTSGLDASTA